MTTVTLLDETIHGTASGNYDGVSTEFAGNHMPAADYYRLVIPMQTVVYSLTGFNGSLAIQISLVTEPTENDWVTVHDISTLGDTVTEDVSTVTVGSFVWVRAKVSDFVEGTINSIIASY